MDVPNPLSRSRPAPATSPRSLVVLAALIATTVALGAASSLLQGDSLETWYPTLDKPGFTPPNVVFGPVWTTLYVLMATAAWLDWRRVDVPRARVALALFAAQLVLNLAWTGIFFGLQRPGWALVELVVQLALVLAWIWATWQPARLAAVLLLPLAAWLTYAGALNAAIVIMN
jgi:tryptophan-rich sensory protein